jgi:hypothetical protein
MIGPSAAGRVLYHKATNNPVDLSLFWEQPARYVPDPVEENEQYEAIPEARRVKYFLHPSIWRRFKHFWIL